MPARCCVCDQIIPPERVEALIDTVPIEAMTCIQHAFKGSIVGFMAESSGGTGDMRNIGRKGGYVLHTLRSDDPNFKENLRLAQRAHRRSR